MEKGQHPPFRTNEKMQGTEYSAYSRRVNRSLCMGKWRSSKKKNHISPSSSGCKTVHMVAFNIATFPSQTFCGIACSSSFMCIVNVLEKPMKAVKFCAWCMPATHIVRCNHSRSGPATYACPEKSGEMSFNLQSQL